MIANIPQILLSLFFVYFVLLSDSCSQLLQCRVQQYIEDSLLFKHLAVFASIFVFTFLLDWYSFGSLVPQTVPAEVAPSPPSSPPSPSPPSSPPSSPPEHSSPAEAYVRMTTWLLVSFVIYFAFVLINKTEPEYFIAILAILTLMILIFSCIKMVASSHYSELLGEAILTRDSYHGAHPTTVIALHNITSALFALILLLIGAGCAKYYQRQRAEHAKSWSWVTFVFGVCNRKS